MTATNIQPNKPTQASRFDFEYPMSYPGHPAHELMRGKSVTEIKKDIRAMIGKWRPSDLFFILMDAEAQAVGYGEVFYWPMRALENSMNCSTSTVRRAAKGLRPLIRTLPQPFEPKSSQPWNVNYYQIDWDVFLSLMRTFYDSRTRLKGDTHRRQQALSNYPLSTMADMLTKVLEPDREALCQKRPPTFSDLVNSDRGQAIERLYKEEASRFKVFAAVATLLAKIRRTHRDAPVMLAEWIVRTKFEHLPEELTEWLEERAPQMNQSDIYALAEATLSTEVLDPLDIIKRFQRIALSLDDQPD